MAARLRSWRDERGYPTPGEMLDEAADEIERLLEKESLLLAAGDLLEHQLMKVARERDALRTCEPQPALTADERNAISAAADDYLYHQDPGGRAQWIEKTLRALLQRLGDNNE
jgi:hypothetical protein